MGASHSGKKVGRSATKMENNDPVVLRTDKQKMERGRPASTIGMVTTVDPKPEPYANGTSNLGGTAGNRSTIGSNGANEASQNGQKANTTLEGELNLKKTQTDPGKNGAVPVKVVHAPKDVESFRHSVTQVVLLCPEMGELKSVNPDFLSRAFLVASNDLCKKFVEQTQSIKKLEKEKQDQQKTLSELEKEKSVNRQLILRKDNEIANLRETISRLRDDLTKANTSSALHPPTSQRVDSRGGTLDADFRAAKQTDGSLNSSENFNSYFREESVVSSGRHFDSLDSAKTKFSDTLERLKTSSEALAATKSTQSPIGLTPRQNQLERYANIQSKYGRLEESAIGRIYIMVKEHATNVISDSQRSRFICAVMETAYHIASLTVQDMYRALEGVLSNPFQIESMANGQHHPRQNNNFEDFNKNIQAKSRSNPASRAEVSDVLWQHLCSYLDSMPEEASLASLTKRLIESLKRLYPECTPSILLNQQVFIQFVQECCRTALQMVVTNPPLHLSTDGRQMDHRQHETLMQERVERSPIDYFLWPTLFDRFEGDVLYKGRVVLKS